MQEMAVSSQNYVKCNVQGVDRLLAGVCSLLHQADEAALFLSNVPLANSLAKYMQ